VTEIVDPETRLAGNEVRKLMATYKEKADLISIGAYQPGTDPLTDAAIQARAPIDAFLRQSVDEASSAEDAEGMLAALATLSGSVEVLTPEPQGPGTPLQSAIPSFNMTP
jgi:flagellum-specific ATP synthase